MAIYSTAQNIAESNSYGNVAMQINIYRGDCTRTEKSVSFKFGVCFTPNGKYWTENSIAAWYNGEQRFASITSVQAVTSRAEKNTTYHAKFLGPDRSTAKQNTSEYLCFSYTKSDILATTKSVSVTIGVGWKDYAGTNRGNLTFSLPIDEFHGALTSSNAGTVTIEDIDNNEFTIKGTLGKGGANNKVTSYDLSWKYSDESSYTILGEKLTAAKEFKKTLSVKNTTDTSRTVQARLIAHSDHSADFKVDAKAVSVKHYTDVTPGTPTISDNGNNSFTVTLAAGATSKGINNPIKTNILYYKIGSNSVQSKPGTITDGGSAKIEANVELGSSVTSSPITVVAYTKATGANYHTTTEKKSTEVSKAIKNYVRPSNVTSVTFTSPSGKFKLDENWTASWSGAEKANGDSSIAGYRVRLYHTPKGSSTTSKIAFYNSSGTNVSTSSDSGYYYDTDSTAKTLTIVPAKQKDIAKGDKLKIGVYAYTKNKNGKKLCSPEQEFSAEKIVGQGSNVHVKVGGAWTEGQVYVKVAGVWKEADAVYTKVAGVWKESQ